MVRRAIVGLAYAIVTASCTCDIDRSKLDSIRCDLDADCPLDRPCTDGYCTAKACSDVADCGDRLVFECVSGICRGLRCSANEDCGPASGCEEGFCIPQDCDPPCGDGLVCEQGSCVPQDCDPPCGDDLVCEQGSCVPQDCDPPCGDDLVCEQGSCVPQGCDPPCGDGLFCNGLERCEAGECQDGEPPCADAPGNCIVSICDEDAAGCTQGEGCDDTLACTDDLCLGDGTCQNTVAQGCAIAGTCWNQGDVNPGDPCLLCDASADPSAWTAKTCDDSLACTNDLCLDDGTCQNTVAQGCAIAGACRNQGDVNPEDECQRCDAVTSTSAWTGDPTDDGIGCTEDSCVDAVAIHAPNDGLCEPSEVCVPCSGGCIASDLLALSCDELAAPGGGASCEIQGAPGGADCASCTAVVGIVPLFFEGFDGCHDLLEAGWNVENVDGAGACPPPVLLPPNPAVAEDALQVGGGATVTLDRYVDTSDLDQVRLCFDQADYGADGNVRLAVLLDTGGAWGEVYADTEGPIPGVDWTWLPTCLDLDDLELLVADAESVGVRIVASSGGNNKDLFLDNVALDAWSSAHVTFPEPAVDDFAACGLGAWVVTSQEQPTCPISFGESDVDALAAQDSAWTMRRQVDASAICDDVRISFRYGTHGATAEDSLRLLFDEDGGGGGAVAWANWGTVLPNDEMASIEVNLSHLSPTVRWNPAIDVTVRLESTDTNATLVLDDSSVGGALCGPADGVVTLGPLEDADQDGDVDFSVSSGVQTTAHLSCTLRGRPDLVRHARVVFRN
jgi:hypothetical protein